MDVSRQTADKPMAIRQSAGLSGTDEKESEADRLIVVTRSVCFMDLIPYEQDP